MKSFFWKSIALRALIINIHEKPKYGVHILWHCHRANAMFALHFARLIEQYTPW